MLVDAQLQRNRNASEVELEFSPADAVRRARSPEEELMFSRRYKTACHRAAADMGERSFCLLPYALLFLLQLLVGLAVAGDRPLLDTGQLPATAHVNVYWQTLLRSMWIAARVMIFSLLLGYPLAYYLSFHAGKEKISSISW